MPTWLELDQQFRELQPALRHHRLDYQWGAAGLVYDLSGARNDASRRFEALASLSGRKLQEVPPDTLHEEIFWRDDPKQRWYEALKHHSSAFAFGLVATQDDGGRLFTGSIESPVTASAVLALQLSAVPTSPPAGLWQRVNGWLVSEREERGLIWGVAFAVLTLLTAVLALL